MKEELKKEKDAYIARRISDIENYNSLPDVSIEMIKFRLDECWTIAQQMTEQKVREEEYELRKSLI